MLQLATNTRQPVDTQPGVHRLVGHCRLSVAEDGKICTDLTKAYYNADLGARSLANGVKELEHEFSTEYSNSDELITEDINTGPLQHFMIRRILVSEDQYEVGVFRHDDNDWGMPEPVNRSKWEEVTETADTDPKLGTWPWTNNAGRSQPVRDDDDVYAQDQFMSMTITV
jgi:hypothetical protein